ncbi:MAG: di-trans,poly-cis-decaprenylcistransferase [Campylobacteraceae bacterium]|nr:di-trans,poly-cis-decaprenylcistransferase [Campylobacteraceae bacterium]
MISLKKELPAHIAIIMDGNGRWAKERNLKRTAGHEEGANTVRRITKHCAKLDIKFLTLYAFSTENWNRPILEVEFLMRLLNKHLKKELVVYLENNIRFKAIGDLSRFSKSLQNTIQETQNKTKKCTGLTQVLALNYGSRNEITRALQKLVDNKLDITEENISASLDTSFMPDVDMLIRTSGEVRLSNYLLWQNAYSEMFFTSTYWPEFTSLELDDMLSDFDNRERRFGGI